MKKRLLYIWVFCSSMGLQAQDIITYNTAQPAGTKEACKGFSLKPGFSFKAATGSSMALRINTAACSAQSSSTNISANQNYVVTLTPLGQTKSVTFSDKAITVDRSIEGDVDVLTQIQYFDGLGRPVQTINLGATPSKKDMLHLQEYDAFGRESRTWLPLNSSVSTGEYRNPADIITRANTEYKDSRAFSEPKYEASPLNRIVKQYGPGDAWKNNPVTIGYLTNNSTYPCVMYTVGGTKDAPTLIKGSNYPDGQLYVTQMGDEAGNISYEFKDKLGQVVLTRQMEGTEKYDTYYVYDDFGNLTFVLPPVAATAADLNLYGYQYIYDGRNRCTQKKLPGAEWIYYVYDKADRLIFTQDGEQRTKGEWLFSLPDALGRARLSGICTKMKIGTATTETAITIGSLDNIVVNATWAKATNTFKGYTISGATPSTFSVLTANYYDSYEFMGLNGIPAITDTHFKPETIAGYGVQYTGGHKGLLTGSWTALLDGSASGIYSVMYYDYKGQVIQTKSNNHLPGGIEKEYIAYTFAGSPTQKMHVHMASGKTTQTELYMYAYDHAGRLTSTKHKLNTGSEVLLAQNTYDELGRLNTTTANNQPNLKNTYAYNIRSWTNSITNNHFIEKLTYNLNGNIATQNWLQDGKNRTYTFAYDNLSRMKSATYSNTAVPKEKFAENLTYDKMGNITSIKRDGLTGQDTYGVIDDLTFGYTGNQLLYIADTGASVSLSASADFKEYSKVTTAEYTFNRNGAMTKDLNKGIVSREGTNLRDGISYNALNLPVEMVINNDEVKAKNYYTYTATGTKLKVIRRYDPKGFATPLLGTTPEKDGLNPKNTTDYVGNKIYEDGVLKMILTDNGYIEGNSYYFYIKDHLGNNRVVANASAGAIQSNQFYPFGMAFAEGTTTEQGKQPYKYNGKELDQIHGLNLYDYSARYYDPAYSRFTTVDPLAEKYYSISPYVYAANNPMKFIDPTGMAYRYVYANEEEGEKGGYYVNDDGERAEWEEVQKWLTATDNITDQNDNWGDLSLYVYGNLQYVTDNLSAAQFSGASLGHSWIKLNGNNGSVTTFGTFKKGIVADGLNQGKTFQVNYEKELAYKYEGNPEAFTYMSMPITNKQRLLIDMFNLNKDNKGNSISTDNTKWGNFQNCTDYAVSLWNTITGNDLYPSSWVRYPTTLYKDISSRIPVFLPTKKK
ncbi:RHS repeat-associated core domain-containing protein [Dysgonomonas sp. HDW5B]|uniref:DUF6443 domain-containing protein n=1 Tax=Dysgonomonas sp. HDW5B TaxID=2714927 RepID=UPI00140D05BE|nr:DUF6443 domain-containing protein [Dysgonomonas sp. HDW5B]QIK55243.1 RHS repeat-associated core domain-containing protein [Dysgonomonas sp. HDW5B]